MAAKEFMALVAEMRKSQKNYFKTRNTFYLNKTKALEQKVDKAIEAEKSDQYGKQQDLF